METLARQLQLRYGRRALANVYRIGADENGLGARLGPLVVTAVLAEVDEQGQRTLAKKLPKKIRQDLDDSKRLMSHHEWSLGEAWARALVGHGAAGPDELFARLSLLSMSQLQSPCAKHVAGQCWGLKDNQFQAEPALVRRVARHLEQLAERGVRITLARSNVVCTKRLNEARLAGGNRFVADLHAMEEVILSLRESTAGNIHAICGKVGSMSDYSKFFGPLAGRLHVVLERQPQQSSYHFPGLGNISFVRDADSQDALVMLASLIGKYVRELLMRKIALHYQSEFSHANLVQPRAGKPHRKPPGTGNSHKSDSRSRVASNSDGAGRPSGYHDPVTQRFVDSTAQLRKRQRIPIGCFERSRGESTQTSTPVRSKT